MTSRIELDGGAWLEYLSWIDATDADRLLIALRDELAWEQREIVMFGRRVLQPRLIAWAGSLGYRYSGQTLEPRAPTPTTAALMARVVEHTQVPPPLGVVRPDAHTHRPNPERGAVDGLVAQQHDRARRDLARQRPVGR